MFVCVCVFVFVFVFVCARCAGGGGLARAPTASEREPEQENSRLHASKQGRECEQQLGSAVEERDHKVVDWSVLDRWAVNQGWT